MTLGQNFNPQVPCGTRRQEEADIRRGKHFNPQVPCGTRLTPDHNWIWSASFQSTGPLRDPTEGTARGYRPADISIHRSLAGPDAVKHDYIADELNFNPQVPCGTRHDIRNGDFKIPKFQSTGPLRDPTTGCGQCRRWHCDFNPQVPCGTRLLQSYYR